MSFDIATEAIPTNYLHYFYRFTLNLYNMISHYDLW